MKSDILNNECTGVSPCKNCPRHLQGLDKNSCIDTCQRLAAYREGKPYRDLNYPEIIKQKETAKIEETEAKDQEPEVEDPEDKPETTENICIICKKNPIYNKRTKTCSACYQQLRMGAIDHPVSGKWKSSWVKHEKNNPSKNKEAEKIRPKYTLVKLYLKRYPHVEKYVYEEAERLGLPLRHVVLSLLAEAVAARKNRQS